MRLSFLSLLLVVTACGATIEGVDSGNDGDDDGSSSCAANAQRCDGTRLTRCTDGVWTTQEQCPYACNAALGCVLCEPGAGTCSAGTATTCLPDGSGFQGEYCDPELGVSCTDGTCQGACSSDSLGSSYIGCEYFPTVTAQPVNPNFTYSIVVSNTGNLPANVAISGGALATPIALVVQPQEVKVQDLPWVPQLKMCNVAGFFGCENHDPFVVKQVSGGSYHVKSTQPITVYQFSPKDYASGGGFTYTNDASLLLPANAMTGSYRVASYSPFSQFGYPGFLAVTAARNDTIVTITPSAASTGTPSFPVDSPTSVTLQQGDVIQIPSTTGDLTGSLVEANRPVQVISGHYCTNVPLNITACDHLEESMFPIETLSDEYLITAPAVPAIPAGKEEVIRIIATEANTTLTYDPALPSAPTTIANPGDFIEIARQVGDYKVTASSKVLVAQYMEGQDAGGGTGDPAMTLAVATDQYRKGYQFHAPTNYVTNYVNVTAPTGTTVMLDGSAVGGWTAIGNSGFSVARVILGAGTQNDGNHVASSGEAFGISVYGYGDYTSYWYPGGLNLGSIVLD